MFSKEDLKLIREWILLERKDAEEYIRLLEIVKVQDTLERMFPGEDMEQAKSRIQSRERQKIADINRIVSIIDNEIN